MHYQELTTVQQATEVDQAAADYAKLVRSKKSRGIMVCFLCMMCD
jgi:hypothetical protein